MADIFYGMNRADQETDIVTQASSPTKHVEIVVDDAVNLTRGELIVLLRLMINHILKEDTYI